ncbi:50S ribosomal protein L11 methyltransferase [Roseimaritima sediminicola]|uniref:50S ribosomal protein L11 methyltransferase n=1 Tax=Roseimaritima sediminicola TaxID=2662066 RepID=UPI00129840FA|nr:class I SAM-dependent methyltransferase [Roseimaritima sediminicola]
MLAVNPPAPPAPPKPSPTTPTYKRVWLAACLVTLVGIAGGCPGRVRQDLSYEHDVVQSWTLESLSPHEVVQFRTVAWTGEESAALRKQITDQAAAEARSVLELRTGTGVLSLLCARSGATRVVATDVNPAAVACARYNAARHDLDNVLEVRGRDESIESASPFAVLQADERFDLILAHAPSEDAPIESISDHAFCDPDYRWLRAVLEGLPQHLKPGGRCLLSFTRGTPLEIVRETAEAEGWTSELLEERTWDEDDEQVHPAQVIEIKLPIAKVQTPAESMRE